MSSRTILDNDFEFNNLHLTKLQFSDNTVQTTAYNGSSPLPQQIVYPITTTTILYCNNNLTATTSTNFQIVNLFTMFNCALFFQDVNDNNISYFDLNFSNSITNTTLEITLLNSIGRNPLINTAIFAYLVEISTGILTYCSININTDGSVVVIINNVNITQSQTYRLNVFTCPYI
jgi:hypothetical protein